MPLCSLRLPSSTTISLPVPTTVCRSTHGAYAIPLPGACSSTVGEVHYLGARDQLLADLQTLTSAVKVYEPFPPFVDQDDRFLLAIARDGAADALVTGDGDLQDMGQMGRTLIVSRADFLKALDEGQRMP